MTATETPSAERDFLMNTTEYRDQQLAKLREQFAPEQIGKLPKAGLQLDYVGHAVVTARLLDVDPQWTWEPFARDERGAPTLDAEGNLWIKLTVLGITRPGVGDGPDMKQRIGDAIRNAAMRFGVALELWSKEELYASTPEPWQGWDSKADGERAHAELVQFVLDNLGDAERKKVKEHPAWAAMMHRTELETVFDFARDLAKKCAEPVDA